MVCKYQHLPDPGRSAEWICYDETGRVWFFRKTQKLLGFKLELPKVMSHARVLLVFIFPTLCSHQMSSSCIGCVPRNKNLHQSSKVFGITPHGQHRRGVCGTSRAVRRCLHTRRLPANLPRELLVGTLAWFVNLVCVNCFSLFELAASYFFLASSHGLLLRCRHVDASGLQ